MTTSSTSPIAISPMLREERRAFAAAELSKLVFAAADRDALCSFLRATYAQSAEDRGDDLCTVIVEGATRDVDVARIEGRDEKHIAALSQFYGRHFTTERRRWTHSWLRRRSVQTGDTLPREAWIQANADAILRAGGLRVRMFQSQEWVTVVQEAPEATFAERVLALVEANPALNP